MCESKEVQVVANMSNTDSEMKTVEWRDINWRQAERYVFKLQKRIYAASRCGEVSASSQTPKDVDEVLV